MEATKKCQLDSKACGSYGNYSDIVILKTLVENVANMFNADIEIAEFELISLRSENALNPDGYICSKHRFKLGKFYKPTTQCKYSDHPEDSKSKGQKVSWMLYNFVKHDDPSFVLGSLICKLCQLKLFKMISDSQMECDEEESADDPDFENSIAIFDEKIKLQKREQLDSLTNIVGMKRVRFQANSVVENLSSSSLSYFRSVHTELKNKITDKFCDLIAPGQALQMKHALENKEDPETDPFLTHLKDAFDSCNSRKARRAVLMMIPKEYSKSKVCEMFGCSFYEVEKARYILKKYGVCVDEPRKEQVYSRLSITKAQHFVNYLFSTSMLQELAYGTTKLKLDSGSKVTVGNTILNGIHEHAVKQYKVYCNEINYQSLGRSTLLKMLDRMKPHTRKKLAGVDTFVVEGIEAFEELKKLAKLLESDDETKKILKSVTSAENYLKARYKTHCQCDDSCGSHCIDHALSHPSDKKLLSKCNKLHNSVCEECLNLVDCISTLKLKASKISVRHKREVAEYEVAMAEKKIFDWQKHIMRGVQQTKARTDAFSKLEAPPKALWIRDFAQRVNPSKTLESMTEYFGKRGMTVSVEVFISRVFSSYQKQVYLVALDRCDQGSLETLCIADTVLKQFCKDNPHIKSIELKSDNAANYHANGIPETMYKVAENHGISLSAYNYNEAQLGKDQCDREAAFFKKCVEQWLLTKETNRITNAKELVGAIFANGGPKNTKMCVIKIDKEVTKIEGIKNIKNISYYHSVDFEQSGARYREYYGIGEGIFHKYNEINFVNGASYVLPWTNSVIQESAMMQNSRSCTKFACSEPMCILEFTTESDMMTHVASGNHKYVRTITGMDKAVLFYAQQKQVQNVSTETAPCDYSTILAKCNKTKYQRLFIQGWARKVRQVVRLTDKQKQFITFLFKNGASSKSKLSPEQMADQMKEHMINGEYYFRPDEYLQPKQIRGLISRLKKTENQPIHPVNSISEDDGILDAIDEICDSVIDSDDEMDE